MDSYADFQLLPDPEFSAHHLMNALFTKLHRALVDLDNIQIGASFPAAGGQAKGMGDLLRLHGTELTLRRCLEGGWFKSIRDHADCSVIQAVPADCKYIQVRRVQSLGESDLRRLRRRLVKRTGCSPEEAQQRLPSTAAERLSLPFLALRSASTGQMFRLFIEQKPTSQRVDGTFNTYGISQTATLPFFG